MRPWLVVFALWSLVGLLDACRLYLSLGWLARPQPFWRCLQSVLPDYWIWAALTPLILAVGKRVLFAPGTWVNRGLTLFVAGGMLAAFHLFLVTGLTWMVNRAARPGRTFGTYYLEGFFRWFLVENLFYWAVLALGMAWEYAKKARRYEMAT